MPVPYSAGAYSVVGPDGATQKKSITGMGASFVDRARETWAFCQVDVFLVLCLFF